MRAGVTMIDPGHTYVDAAVHLAADVTLFPGTVLQGRTVVGRGARIGPHTRLADCVVGEGAVVEQTVGLRRRDRGRRASWGRSRRSPPGAHIAPGASTGAFYTGRGGDDDGV